MAVTERLEVSAAATLDRGQLGVVQARTGPFGLLPSGRPGKAAGAFRGRRRPAG